MTFEQIEKVWMENGEYETLKGIGQFFNEMAKKAGHKGRGDERADYFLAAHSVSNIAAKAKKREQGQPSTPAAVAGMKLGEVRALRQALVDAASEGLEGMAREVIVKYIIGLSDWHLWHNRQQYTQELGLFHVLKRAI